jgi:methyl-accepting chemotaxis protein
MIKDLKLSQNRGRWVERWLGARGLAAAAILAALIGIACCIDRDSLMSSTTLAVGVSATILTLSLLAGPPKSLAAVDQPVEHLRRAIDEVASRRLSAQVRNSGREASEPLGRASAESDGKVLENAGHMVAALQAAAGAPPQADEFEEVVGLIQAIAAQTNLLALRAAVKAARSSEAGRGFLEIARDVKILADQATRVSERIDAHVATLRRDAKNSTQAIMGADPLVDGRLAKDEIGDAIRDQIEAAARVTRGLAPEALDDAEAVLREADAAPEDGDAKRSLRESLDNLLAKLPSPP